MERYYIVTVNERANTIVWEMTKVERVQTQYESI